MNKNEFLGKHILVIGAGVSGIAVAQILAGQGAEVMLYDAKPAQDIKRDLTPLCATGVKLALGVAQDGLLDGLHYVVVSPGVPIGHPLIVAANARGICVVSEVEVAYRLCQAPMLAVTGTNGKTTTTTLLGQMAATTGKQVVVGGNIGDALSQETLGLAADGLAVAEISSFQLEGAVSFRPHIAAILNITPDHLDRHGTMEMYIAMKERIFAKQQPNDYLVLNFDDSIVREMAANSKAQVLFFSRHTEVSAGAFIKEGRITLKWQGELHDVCAADELTIVGNHNVENALAACAAAWCAGVQPAAMAEVLRSFGGVEHRIERVEEINGVVYYNDSKATNPESTIKALEAFSGHIILIAGGRDKGTDLQEFMSLVKQRVDHLLLIGEAQARFYQAASAQQVASIHCLDNLHAAVALAHKLAKPPQVVVLSPACSSYDSFANYEERGRVFKELVKTLH